MMRRYRLLDLCCGPGGGARGYHLAGFDVMGVDHEPQPHYPYEFIQADALTFPLDGFDAYHVSPPCGDYCALKEFTTPGKHPRLIEPFYELLLATGKPFVIENSDRAPMAGGVVLCGSMFGLNVRRHRAFWSNVLLWKPSACRHTGHELVFSRTRESVYRDAMGLTELSARAARQAIPPAYTEWIGRQLLVALALEKEAV